LVLHKKRAAFANGESLNLQANLVFYGSKNKIILLKYSDFAYENVVNVKKEMQRLLYCKTAPFVLYIFGG